MTFIIDPYRFASAGPSFFGSYTMYREFWAEDPGWTNPGDGNSLVTIRDNGTAGQNLTATTVGGGTGPTYDATGINNLPSYRFNASSATVGGHLTTASGVHSAATFTVGVVADLGSSWNNCAVDGQTGSTFGQCMIQSEAGSPIKWRGKHRAGGEVVANQVASGVRFMVMKVATNDLDLYENGSGLGTDSGLGLLDVTGFTLGSDGPRTGGLVSGLISYAFMYAGDLVADGGYATWSAGIMTYYGIT